MSSQLRRTLAVAIAAFFFVPAGLIAQDPQQPGPAVADVGRVEFQTSCGPEAQVQFERGLALLHSFWWDQAGNAFRRAAELDPNCVMAFWGQAVSLRLNPFAGATPERNLGEARGILSEALARNAGTVRERAYLEAIAAYYQDFERVDHGSRALTYEVKMRELAQRFPDDREATIFYALAAAANASTTDTTFARQREIGAVLDSLFVRFPDHPGLAHYIIHVYDSPALAHLGLDAARRYARIAPAAYHARHMPSHIFVRLGMWDETIASNLASAEASADLERREHLDGVHYHRLHAMDYLMYAYLQQGRDREARRVARETAKIDHVVPAGQSLVSQYAFASIPARYALERRDWQEAARLPLRPAPEFRAAEGITHFARGIGASRSGDPQAARAEATALHAIEQELARDAYWSQLVKAQRLAVSSWIAFAEGDTTSALLAAAEAADLEDATDKHPVTPGYVTPARELQADLLAELGRHEDAGAAYAAVLQREPNRARSVFGAAWAAQLAGQHAAAADWYRRYAALMEKGDGDRPEIAVAEAYVQGYAQQPQPTVEPQ